MLVICCFHCNYGVIVCVCACDIKLFGPKLMLTLFICSSAVRDHFQCAAALDPKKKTKGILRLNSARAYEHRKRRKFPLSITLTNFACVCACVCLFNVRFLFCSFFLAKMRAFTFHLIQFCVSKTGFFRRKCI